MATATLSATKRSDTGKGVARTLRRDGHIPGVIYGRTRDPQPLSINARELSRLLEHISAENTVIDLTIDGTTARTLIRQIQRHPLKRDILHVDLMELVAGEKVEVRIPILLQGTPEGVRTSGGTLDQIMRELRVRVDPSHIPERIEVDVTELSIGHSIHVNEISVPEGVEVLDDDESTIATVVAPRAVEEPTPVAAEGAEPAEPELIRERKGDEEEGAEAEPEKEK
ncbi:MAG TPA: 50S ribosomal protein L25/general stress protein Ctc [Gemmatimonadaceae bacterium]|nr:50S ribosomal protein L25/general stress protein Ctc [Gemmatimonadaceae bacterium]